MLEELYKAVGSEGQREKTLIIIDGGIATKENVKLLGEEGFGYLVNENRRGRGGWREEFFEQEGFEKVEGRDEHRQVKVKWIEEPVGEKPGREADQEPGHL